MNGYQGAILNETWSVNHSMLVMHVHLLVRARLNPSQKQTS